MMYDENVKTYSLCDQEGKWVDYATQLPPATPVQWLHFQEPTGYAGEVI